MRVVRVTGPCLRAPVRSLFYSPGCHVLLQRPLTSRCSVSTRPSLIVPTLAKLTKLYHSQPRSSNVSNLDHSSVVSARQALPFIRPLSAASYSYHSMRQPFEVRQYGSTAKPIESFRLIDGEVDVASRDYELNCTSNAAHAERYLSLLRVAISGGDAKAVERHTIKNGKLLVADRLRRIFDDDGDLLEVSALAGMGMKYGDIPRGGIVTVIGRICGVYCMVWANDATVKAGTIYPITLKKQLRAMEIVQQNGLPAVFIVDSGGAFLPLQADIFLPGGRTFYNEAVLNERDIPQVAIVCGSCTAGAAYIPTMAQEAIIIERLGTIFLAGPPLVQAALGEVVSAEELGGARMHSSVSGCTDYFAKTEDEAYQIGRASVAAFNIAPVYNERVYSEPVYDSAELLGIVPANGDEPMDMFKVLSRLVDGSRMHEFKARYAATIVTGFCHIHDYLVGVVGNNGPLTGEAALKATHFIQLCSQRNIPLVLLQNITSDHSASILPSVAQAGLDGDALRHKAKLMSCLACCDVPIITIVVGNSFGMDSYMMGGRAFNPRFLFRWPNARICIGDPQRVAGALCEEAVGRGESSDEAVAKKTKEELKHKSSALHASSQGWDDGVILPQDTRQVLGHCLNIINQSRRTQSVDKTSKAVLRM